MDVIKFFWDEAVIRRRNPSQIKQLKEPVMCHKNADDIDDLKITHIDQGCNENRLKGDYLKTPGCWPKVSFDNGITVSWRPRPRGDLNFCFTDRYGDFWDAEYDALVTAHIAQQRDFQPSNWKEPTYEAFAA